MFHVAGSYDRQERATERCRLRGDRSGILLPRAVVSMVSVSVRESRNQQDERLGPGQLGSGPASVSRPEGARGLRSIPGDAVRLMDGYRGRQGRINGSA